MLELIVILPGQSLSRVSVPSERMTVGTLGLNTIPLSTRGIAPQQLELLPQGEELGLKNLAPQNAVRVNGQLTTNIKLKAGDVVEVGGAFLVVDRPVHRASAASSSRQEIFRCSTRIFDLTEKLLAELPQAALLVEVLDVLMELFATPRALLLELKKGARSPQVLAARGDWPEGRLPGMSRTVVAKLKKNPVPILVADVPQDPDTSSIESLSLEVRSMVVGPLVEREELVGLVYLESPEPKIPFGEEERAFLEHFCRFAARVLAQGRQALEIREERERFLELHHRTRELPEGLEDLVGKSPAIELVKAQIRQVAGTDVTTLILGESGTGKELVASAIHRLSARRPRPFVAVNCTALPDDLVESELFGHVAGAFSGAQKDRLGRFELAHSGTLFLDEVGDLALGTQVKFLRALQERVIVRVGEARDRPVDVRIVAATNAPLEERIREGRFRDDLFYRLCVFTIRLPPLRERMEDLPLLAHSLCLNFAGRMQKPIGGVSPAALDVLAAHNWPGNVRELANVMQQAVVRENSALITPQSLSFAIIGRPESKKPKATSSSGVTLDEAKAVFERGFIEDALAECAGDIPRVLKQLGLPRGTFYRRCAALGVEPSRFRKGGA
jgi:transcriptional regulator with GAF, ATPase, and Fis domain